MARAGRVGPRIPATRTCGDRRSLAAAILVGVTTVFGIAPLWLLDTAFVETDWYGYSFTLGRLVVHDPLWTVAGCATTLAPVWYCTWRRWRVPLGGSIGATLAATGAFATAFGIAEGWVQVGWFPWRHDSDTARIVNGTCGVLLASAIAYTVAFLVARPPASLAPHERSHRKTATIVPAYALCLAGVYVLIALAWSGTPLVTKQAGCRICSPPEPMPLLAIVGESSQWAVGAGSIVFAPLFLPLWQRTAFSYGRVCGVATAASGGLAILASLVRAYANLRIEVHDAAWLVPLAAAAFVAAFAVAPQPRDPRKPDAAEVSRLLRRHRATFRPR
jgi:hypothetical protein